MLNDALLIAFTTVVAFTKLSPLPLGSTLTVPLLFTVVVIPVVLADTTKRSRPSLLPLAFTSTLVVFSLPETTSTCLSGPAGPVSPFSPFLPSLTIVVVTEPSLSLVIVMV